MPSLPTALPSPPGIPPPPGLPQPPLPPIPNLPKIPTPPVCNLQLPALPNPAITLATPAIVLCKWPLPIPQKSFKANLKVPTAQQLLAKLGIPPVPYYVTNPPIPPIPKNCLLDNPLLVLCGLKFGGGRTVNPFKDPDVLLYAA